MLGKKINQFNPQIWLINTGWTAGAYGVGSRIKLNYTRAMISAVLSGQLNDVKYATHDVFGLQFPTVCPGVPDEVLNPRNTWSDSNLYDQKAFELAKLFNSNFEKYQSKASQDIIDAGPKKDKI